MSKKAYLAEIAAWDKLQDEQMPKFGDRFENVHASGKNPRKFCFFVRAGRTPHGKLNPGPWWEMTDGRGDFWKGSPEIYKPVTDKKDERGVGR